MSNQAGCAFCESADPKRQKDGKIRCTAYSEWRDPFGSVCKSYFDKTTAESLEEIRKLKGGDTR